MLLHTYNKNEKKQLTKNFNLNEFHCNCAYLECSQTYITEELLVVLQVIRNYFKECIKITSAYRCFRYNKDISGAINSQHLNGFACDIQVIGVSAFEVQEYLIMNQRDLNITIGRYNTFTHIDVRDELIVFDMRDKGNK